MTRSMRVIHLPARTPYVHKLQGPDFHILNNTTTAAGHSIPDAPTCAWLLERRPFTWFDVLHLHHIEFEPLDALTDVMDACHAAGVSIVFTVHDLEPIFTPAEALMKRLAAIADADARLICLTEGSAHTLRSLLPRTPPPSVIPHGYVVAPERLRQTRATDVAGSHRYLLYGAIRPNRDHMSTLTNWSLGLTDPAARLHLMVRALSPADFAPEATPRITDLLAITGRDPRIQVTMRPYPTDAQLVNAALNTDAILLPYLWGSHSGQLEFAFDMGLLAVCAAIGYVKEQYQAHHGLVTEPVWFDWANGHPYLFGERFLTALETAHHKTASHLNRINKDFLDHRTEEHHHIINRHTEIYHST